MPTPAPPPETPDVGDTVRIVDDLHVGDLCYLERDWDGTWLVKRLDDLNSWSFDRPLLTLGRGDEPNSGHLRVLTDAELHSLFNADRAQP